MKKRFENLCFLLTYAWKKCKALYFASLGKAVFNAFLPLIDIAGLGLVVDALVNNSPRHEVMRLILYFLLFNLAVALLSQLLTLVENIIMRKASDITQRDYMNDSIRIDYHYAQDRSILDLKKKSMGANPAWFILSFGQLIKCVVQFVGIAYLFSVLSPLFLSVLLLTSVLSILFIVRERRLDFAYRNESTEDERAMDYLYKTMTDSGYAKEVRINRADSILTRKYSERYKVHLERKNKLENKRAFLHICSLILTVVQSIAMYLYFSHQVFSAQIGVGEYTVLLGATTLLAGVLLEFFNLTVNNMAKTLDFTDLFREYQNHVTENSKIFASRELPMQEIDRENLKISFEDVTFTYPGSQKPVLEHISFTIMQGEKLGIVGLNGSGKTTLIKLLCRLYDPTQGRITLNDIDIRKIPHDEYTKLIGIVLQDFCLFAYSVRENVVFDGQLDETHLYESIEKSGLSDKIMSLPNGANTSIYKTLDDEGIEFSGGEGQKLALARAIYKNAGIMILDEPTSALDPLAELALFSRLADIADGRTTLFISHRLSSTKFCDPIIVLSDGKIAEIGSHDTLMEKDGIYADLFHTQAKYYESAEVKT